MEEEAPTMNIISLQSGSNGNCIYVEAGGVKLLFDAGISGKRAKDRLAMHGRDISDVDALIISHDHGDHSSSTGVFQRRFRIPLYITRKTLEAVRKYRKPGVHHTITHFHPGDTLSFGPVRVETFATPHDGADGSAFIIDDGTNRLGIFTDLGHVFPDLIRAISSLDAVVLESNYDPGMLDAGPYPLYLKQRIRGPGGHLSNVEAAELAGRAGERLRWVCLAHLSEKNNTPEIAVHTHLEIAGKSLKYYVADRYAVSDILTV